MANQPKIISRFSDQGEKVWRQVKMQKKQHTNFEQEEDIFMGDKDLSSEKKMSEYAPSSKNHIQRQQHSVL